MKKLNLRSVLPAYRDGGKLTVPIFPFKKRSDLDFFTLSNRIYNNISSGKEYLDIECFCLAVHSNHNTGYYGAAFLDLRLDNTMNKPMVIIAHRGTEAFSGFGTDILQADLSILMQNIPDQFDDAYDLTNKVLATIGRKKNIVVTHTGHSLGGALAQLCAHQFGHRSIGFEVPGMLAQIDQIKSIFKYESNEPQHITFNMADIYISKELPAVGQVFNATGRKKWLGIPLDIPSSELEKGAYESIIKSIYGILKRNPRYMFASLHWSARVLTSIGANIGQFHSMKAMQTHFDVEGNFLPNPKMIE